MGISPGFSSHTLAGKLGIEKGFKVFLWNMPPNYLDLVGRLPKDVNFLSQPNSQTDLIQAFATQKTELEELFPQFKSVLKPKGSIWISWPKKARIESKDNSQSSDLDENIVREVGLKNGLVDVKVISVDNVWSGLKFVYRLADRSG